MPGAVLGWADDRGVTEKSPLGCARCALGAAMALTAAFSVSGPAGGWRCGLFTRVVFNAVLLLAVAPIGLRAVAVRRERGARCCS